MSNANQDVDVVGEVTRVLRLEGESILACVKRIQADPSHGKRIQTAVGILHQALENGGKIIVTGVGKSGKVGQKVAATLCSTGSLAVFLHPTEGLHGDLGVISSSDAVLAFSYTGNTDEVVRLLPSLKKLAVPLIGVGGNDQSRIALASDIWLDAAVEQEACPHNLAPTSSTTLALAWGDALAMALMRVKGFDATGFAQNHPGGALGRRLHLKVGDVMHSGNAVPAVPGDVKLDEVVVQATRGGLGIVLVTAGPRLEGIITDGDIRRALQFREKFFEMKASDIMTRKPIAVSPDAMAQTALELMENRPRPIGVLPVVDEAGNWKGVVRIHDLLSSL